MQDTRTEAHAGGIVLLVSEQEAHLLHSRHMIGVHLDVRQQGKVVAGLYAIQMRPQIVSQ